MNFVDEEYNQNHLQAVVSNTESDVQQKLPIAQTRQAHLIFLQLAIKFA